MQESNSPLKGSDLYPHRDEELHIDSVFRRSTSNFYFECMKQELWRHSLIFNTTHLIFNYARNRNYISGSLRILNLIFSVKYFID
jgi:hypothetical protein